MEGRFVFLFLKDAAHVFLYIIDFLEKLGWICSS